MQKRKNKDELILKNKDEIHSLIMELGVQIPDSYIWSNELRRKFERITSWLSS